MRVILVALWCIVAAPACKVRGGDARDAETGLKGGDSRPLIQEGSPLARITEIFSQAGCSGCHQGATAHASLAQFTTMGDEREFLRSLAYRHAATRAVLVNEGREAVANADRFLGAPAIDPAHKCTGKPPRQHRFIETFERDGERMSDRDRDTFCAWIDSGAELPAEIIAEVAKEIR